jgi:short-subunit dehydrogenase
MQVQDRTVWITGASSGIGAALAVELAARGARLILSARRAEALEAVRARCAHPERHRVLLLDLAEPDSLSAAVEAAGPVDILVNNGGISQRARADQSLVRVDRQLMEVNFFAPVALTKAVLPGMKARHRGQIVVVSSLLGLYATPLRSSYAASKHALHGFFDALRAELHGEGIAVTLLCPGYVRTEISKNALSGDGSAHAALDEGVARGADPATVARRMAVAIEGDRAELVMTWGGVLARFLRATFPGLSRFLMRTLRPT